MASYAKDPRCTAMAEALAPLLRRNCPEGAGGFGGSYQVNDEEAVVGWGGMIRAAMRKAARQLGWKVTTIGMVGARHGTMVVVQDVREVPEEHQAVLNDAMNGRMRAAQSVGRAGPGPCPARLGGLDDSEGVKSVSGSGLVRAG
ncbi:hypothetical protein [Streptomyces sp. NPDC005525]|uniref:hypothetical protein n=1 Tax=Streptomyces sp. NPDC005525 TaxID=3364720 RepID=UPI00369D7E02